jgi:hypothetical protein
LRYFDEPGAEVVDRTVAELARQIKEAIAGGARARRSEAVTDAD